MTLLLLDVVCPRCGKPPNVRITPMLVSMATACDPDHVIATWACQRRGCSERVLITARMIQRAKEVTPLTTRGAAG